jgi:hypothetical protein
MIEDVDHAPDGDTHQGTDVRHAATLCADAGRVATERDPS